MDSTLTSTPTTMQPKATTAGSAKELLDLPGAIRLFFKHPSPWILVSSLLAAWSVRASIGGWSLWDAAVVVGILAWWPVQEWLIHVYLLHWKPRQVGPITLDFPTAQRHRRHHRHPQVVEWSYLPLAGIAIAMPIQLTLWHVLLPVHLAWTALGMFFALSLHYEWVHVMSHMPYRPRVAWYRHLREKHLLHHYRNEDRWLGVSMTGGDALFGTGGDKSAHPKSDTCLTLGLPEECSQPKGIFQ